MLQPLWQLNENLPTWLKFALKGKMGDLMADTTRQGQIQVHFVTNSPDIELPEEKRQLLVPTSELYPPFDICKYPSTDRLYRCETLWPLSDSQLGVYARHFLADSLRLLD